MAKRRRGRGYAVGVRSRPVDQAFLNRYYPPPAFLTLPAQPRRRRATTIRRLAAVMPELVRRDRRGKTHLNYRAIAAMGSVKPASCIKLTPAQKRFGAGTGGGGRRRRASIIRKAAIAIERMQQRSC